MTRLMDQLTTWSDTIQPISLRKHIKTAQIFFYKHYFNQNYINQKYDLLQNQYSI